MVQNNKGLPDESNIHEVRSTSTWSQVSEYTRQLAESLDERSEVDIAKAVAEHFAPDTAFMARFLEENFRARIYDIVQRVLTARRRKGQKWVPYMMPTGVVLGAEAPQTSRRVQIRLPKFRFDYDYEVMNKRGNLIDLGDADREDLEAEIRRFRNSARSDMMVAEMLAQILPRLGPGQHVRDVLSREELAALETRVHESVYRTIPDDVVPLGVLRANGNGNHAADAQQNDQQDDQQTQEDGADAEAGAN